MCGVGVEEGKFVNRTELFRGRNTDGSIINMVVFGKKRGQVQANSGHCCVCVGQS